MQTYFLLSMVLVLKGRMCRASETVLGFCPGSVRPRDWAEKTFVMFIDYHSCNIFEIRHLSQLEHSRYQNYSLPKDRIPKLVKYYTLFLRGPY